MSKRKGPALIQDGSDLPLFTGTPYGPAVETGPLPTVRDCGDVSTWGWCGTLLDDLGDETEKETQE